MRDFEIEGSGDKENPLLICHAVQNIRIGTIFRNNGPSYKKKELRMNSTSNTFQRKYENFDENFNCID